MYPPLLENIQEIQNDVQKNIIENNFWKEIENKLK